MSWRDHLPTHPAAEMFPLLSPDELRELGEDIKKNRLQERAKVMRQGDKFVLLDGRSRLDAIEAVGLSITVFEGSTPNNRFFEVVEVDNPIAFVISANIRRRHLTSEDRHRIIGELLKLDPSKSDRQIGREGNADHKTVGAVRDQLERRGEIPHIGTRTDTKGREQPARKPKPSAPPSDAERSAIERKQHYAADNEAPAAPRKFTAGETLTDITWAIAALVRSIADTTPAEVVAELDSTALIELARNAELRVAGGVAGAGGLRGQGCTKSSGRQWRRPSPAARSVPARERHTCDPRRCR